MTSTATELGPSSLTSTWNMILAATDTLYAFEQHPPDLSDTVHQAILQTLRENLQGHDSPSPKGESSTGTTWTDVIERGWATRQKVSILNMVEWMGSAACFDQQVRMMQDAPGDGGRKSGAKTAATRLLNELFDSPMVPGRHADAVPGTGAVSRRRTSNFDTTENMASRSPVKIKHQNRRYVTMQLCRGRRLWNTILIKLNLNILLSPDIWCVIPIDEVYMCVHV